MFKNLFEVARAGWTEFKLYLTRANSYIIIANTGMLLFLMTDRLKEYGLDFSKQGMLGIFIIGMAGIVLLGWLDSKLGFFREECQRTANRNPYWKITIDGIKDIQERLDRLENGNKK